MPKDTFGLTLRKLSDARRVIVEEEEVKIAENLIQLIFKEAINHAQKTASYSYQFECNPKRYSKAVINAVVRNLLENDLNVEVNKSGILISWK